MQFVIFGITSQEILKIEQNQAKTSKIGYLETETMQKCRKSKSHQNEIQEQRVQFCHGYQQSKHIK